MLLETITLSLLGAFYATAHIISSVEEPKPQLQRLPPLREQAALQNEWTDSRIGNIANILRKYEVDAWLVCYPIAPVPPREF